MARERMTPVLRVGFQDPAQMRLAQNDDVIQTLTPDRSDQPFSKAILPRRGWCNRFVPNAHRPQSACYDRTVDAIPVADHVVRGFIPGECFCDLTRNPFRGRMCRDVDPDEASAIEPHDHEGIEQVEADGRDNKQVHRSNIWGTVVQEGAPPLAWRPAPLHHIFGVLD